MRLFSTTEFRRMLARALRSAHVPEGRIAGAGELLFEGLRAGACDTGDIVALLIGADEDGSNCAVPTVTYESGSVLVVDGCAVSMPFLLPVLMDAGLAKARAGDGSGIAVVVASMSGKFSLAYAYVRGRAAREGTLVFVVDPGAVAPSEDGAGRRGAVLACSPSGELLRLAAPADDRGGGERPVDLPNSLASAAEVVSDSFAVDPKVGPDALLDLSAQLAAGAVDGPERSTVALVFVSGGTDPRPDSVLGSVGFDPWPACREEAQPDVPRRADWQLAIRGSDWNALESLADRTLVPDQDHDGIEAGYS